MAETQVTFYPPESEFIEAPCVFIWGQDRNRLTCLVFGDYTGDVWPYTQMKTVKLLRKEFGEPRFEGKISDSKRKSYCLIWHRPKVPANWQPYVDYCDEQNKQYEQPRRKKR